MISNIRIQAFKKIQDASLPLEKINVLVGGNNSGKSCLLQGVHFGVTLSQSQRTAGTQQFAPERLRYCPTDDFLSLRYGARLTETGYIRFTLTRPLGGENHESATVDLMRGRNGVVKVDTTGRNLLNEISDPKSFFSIYVPGLAGIAIREEYRSDLVVNNGIARGDANLYLRNVLLRIEEHADRRTRFRSLLSKVFPDHIVQARFDIANDLWIQTTVKLPDHAERSLDTIGTGFLQAVQLLAYVTNYSPKLLLLDEPDAHLHPNNQRLLAKALNIIAQESDTQILLATHSRHLLDALSEHQDTRLFWIREGSPAQQTDWADIAVLMDLGALDKGEQFLNGNYSCLVWTEDTDTKPLECLLQANGFDLQRTWIFSYQTSSKIDAAAMLQNFVERVRPGVQVLIHRDRDFMTDDEVHRLAGRINVATGGRARLLLTPYSDIEGSLVRPQHLSAVLGMPLPDATALIDAVVRDNNNGLVIKFRDKREEIKHSLYRNDPEACPPAAQLLPGPQISLDQSHGKSVLSLLGPRLQQLGINPSEIMVASNALVEGSIEALRPAQPGN